MRLRWVFTDQPFLPLGTGSIVNNRIWNKDQITLLTVGQMPVDESRFKQDARLRLPAGLVAGHLCHPEWFATGEPWPSDLPPTVYGPNWIPECCGLFQDAAAGGLEMGGAAGDLVVYTDPTAGGVVMGGYAGSIPAGNDPAAGGVQLGGLAGDLVVSTDPAAGGVQTGGLAGDLVVSTDPTAGGVVMGGYAGSLPAGTDPAAGGVQTGGAAGDLVAYLDGAAGGLSMGGECGDVLTYTDPTAGGVVMGGECGDVFDGALSCNDFADVILGQTSFPPYSIGGFDYDVFGTPGGSFGLDGAVSVNFSVDNLRVDLTGGAPTVVRVRVYVTNSGGAAVSGDVRVVLSDGTDDTFATTGPTVREYLSDEALEWVEVYAILDEVTDIFPTMNELCFA